MNVKSKIFLIVLLTLYSCNGSNNNKMQRSKTFEVIKHFNPDANLSEKFVVLVIPLDGCKSCIDESITLIPKVIKTPGLVIIPDRHKRRIENYINEVGIQKDLIVFDTIQLSFTNNIVDINPRIILIENEEIIYSNEIGYATIEEIQTELCML